MDHAGLSHEDRSAQRNHQPDFEYEDIDAPRRSTARSGVYEELDRQTLHHPVSNSALRNATNQSYFSVMQGIKSIFAELHKHEHEPPRCNANSLTSFKSEGHGQTLIHCQLDARTASPLPTRINEKWDYRNFIAGRLSSRHADRSIRLRDTIWEGMTVPSQAFLYGS